MQISKFLIFLGMAEHFFTYCRWYHYVQRNKYYALYICMNERFERSPTHTSKLGESCQIIGQFRASSTCVDNVYATA